MNLRIVVALLTAILIAPRPGVSTSSLGAYAYELDGDGVSDTNLTVSACSGDPQSTCLIVDSITSRLGLSSSYQELRLSSTPNICFGLQIGDLIRLKGDYRELPDGITAD